MLVIKGKLAIYSSKKEKKQQAVNKDKLAY